MNVTEKVWEILSHAKYLSVLEVLGSPIAKFSSEVLGFSEIQSRFIMGLFLSLPLGLLCRACVHRVPRRARSVLSLVTGFQIMWFIYGAQTLHLVACALGTFVLMRALPAAWAYIATFVFCVAYMVCSHIYVMVTAYMSWEPDYTAPLMVLTIKLTSYAFCVHDAHYSAERARGAVAGPPLTPRQERYMVARQPGALDFFGWVFFFPGFFGGPAVEYRDYERYMDGTLARGAIPSCWKEGLAVLAECLGFMACVALLGRYDMSNARARLVDPAVARTIPFWRRYAILVAAAMLQRAKYYSCWLMGELASRASGVGYSGTVRDARTGAPVPSWENAVNVRPLAFETATSLKVAIDVWNMATERWLRHYCYERLAHTRLARWKRLLTFVFSAFWHGIYPAYYLTFLTAGVHREVAALARRKLRPYVLAAARAHPRLHLTAVYDMLTRIAVLLSINPLFVCFGMLSAHDALGVAKNTYFCANWHVLLGIIVLPFIPTYKDPTADSSSKDKGKDKDKTA